MKTDPNINRTYWNERGEHYSDVWKGQAKEDLSSKEERFIVAKLKECAPRRILDIGVGNGRILHCITENGPTGSKVYGIDISPVMVGLCKEKYRVAEHAPTLSVCDLSQEGLPFEETFDFITAIRVFKYNPNWQEMVKKIYDNMDHKGNLIFTMPNKYSISFFHKDTFSQEEILFQYVSAKEIRKELNDIGFTVSDIRGFSRVPEPLYYFSSRPFYIRALQCLESIMARICGRYMFSRILFVVCHKR